MKPNRPLDKGKASANNAGSIARKQTGTLKLRRIKPAKKRPMWVNVVAGIAAFLLVAAMGWYIYTFFTHRIIDPDPNLVQPALNRLRHAPSTQEGLTVDDYLASQLEKSRRIGNLLKYQGWTIKAITGSKTKVVFAFTYEEKDNSEQRAEWVADLDNNTFTPQTELAAAVYKH